MTARFAFAMSRKVRPLTPEEIDYLWRKLKPEARPRYAREFAALRAGTSVGEIDRKRRAENERRRQEAKALRKSA